MVCACLQVPWEQWRRYWSAIIFIAVFCKVKLAFFEISLMLVWNFASSQTLLASSCWLSLLSWRMWQQSLRRAQDDGHMNELHVVEDARQFPRDVCWPCYFSKKTWCKSYSRVATREEGWLQKAQKKSWLHSRRLAVFARAKRRSWSAVDVTLIASGIS